MSRSTRLLTILRTFAHYRLGEFVDQARISGWQRPLLAPFARADCDSPRAVRLRQALEELGPVFIKFGQALSTRRDLLPQDVADELAKLQDNVPPFPNEQAAAIIEQALAKPLAELYSDFESTPMASASVAQVHRAVLHSGERVVVKVLRPDIEPVIRQDLKLLHTLASLVERFVPEGHRLRPTEVVADYETVILDELDLGREAANTSQLRRNFKDSKLVYVPEVFWDYSARNVLTMERITGIPVTDLHTLRDKGTDLKLLGERGVEIFFTQVLRDNFFHADMHPGNIFVDASDPADPTYIAVDCAIVGSLSDADQYYVARNLLAVFQQDYHEVAKLHVESGWIRPDTRVQEFEAAMRTVCEPIFERPISEISFGELLIYLFRTAARFDMEVQPSLVLLQKTLLNIEGLGRQLYPQLNLWETAQPYLERWVQERYSPQTMFRRLQREAPSLLEHLPHLPELLMESLQANRPSINAGTPSPPPTRERPSTSRNGKSGTGKTLLGGAALGVALALAFPMLPQQLAQAPLVSWLLAGAGIALLWPRD